MAQIFSDGEWLIMQALWHHAPRNIHDLTAALADSMGWSRHTLFTLLTHLEEMQAVTALSLSGVLHYTPTCTFEGMAALEVDALIDRLYQGDAAKLVADLAKRGRLPADCTPAS